MVKKYNLKLSETITNTIELYMIIEPLKRGNTISAYLKPVIHKEVNRMLDQLNSERKKNVELQKILKDEKYKEIFKLLETNERF